MKRRRIISCVLAGLLAASSVISLPVAGAANQIPSAMPAAEKARPHRPGASVPTASLRLTPLPLAARTGKTLTLGGTLAVSNLSATETVSVSLARLRQTTWVPYTTTAVAVTKNGSAAVFSAPLKLGRGYWRVTCILPPHRRDHPGASAQLRIRVVGAKAVALTFDDGPWPVNTEKVRLILRNNTVPATFFVLGDSLRAYHSYAQLMVAEPVGHVIGNHSTHHKVLPRMSDSAIVADLATTQKLAKKYLGVTPHWFRPPYGSTSPRVAKDAASLHLRQVIWTVDSLDWAAHSWTSVYSRVMRGVSPNAIVLMHDGGGRRGYTTTALPKIISALRKKGFDFVTLDELAALKAVK